MIRQATATPLSLAARDERAASPDLPHRRASDEGAPAASPPAVSVVLMAMERPGCLLEYYHELAGVLREGGYTFEVIVLAHPEHRALLAPIAALAARGEPVRTHVAGRTLGETALLRLGLGLSRAPVVLTLPAFRQVETRGVLELLAQVTGDADLAVARRWPRQDALVNRLQARVFGRLVNRLAADQVHDMGCGVRAVRRDVLEDLPLYGDFARFLPLLALDRGYRLVEIPVAQHPHDHPSRVYSPGVYLRRAVDLLGLFFLLRFTDKPLRFFGLVGALLASGGGVLLLVLLVQRLQGQGIAQRPALLLASLLVVLGVQAIALGLIGEIVVHLGSTGRRRYRLRETTGAGPARREGPLGDGPAA